MSNSAAAGRARTVVIAIVVLTSDQIDVAAIRYFEKKFCGASDDDGLTVLFVAVKGA